MSDKTQNIDKNTPKKLKGGLTNLKNTKIGYLLVIKKLTYRRGKGVNKKPFWECECTAPGCGEIIKVSHARLIHKTNPKTHCGCQRKGLPTLYKKEYHAYWDAKSRCHNPDHPSYPSYGAKGIRMSERWQESFENFLEDMQECPEGYSLDRIDPHGKYEPDNCRWADNITQARNKKGTKFVRDEESGEDVTVGELAERRGLTYRQMRDQLKAEGKW